MKGGDIGDYMGSMLGVIRGDTRRLDPTLQGLLRRIAPSNANCLVCKTPDLELLASKPWLPARQLGLGLRDLE